MSSFHRAGCEALADVGQLLVSELVTNALLHARGALDVNVSVDSRAARVEVRDSSVAEPEPRTYGTDAGTGRGLLLVEALASRWGADLDGDGKVVWFELDRSAA